MKELKDTGIKPIIETHYPVKERKPMKRWIIAMKTSSHRQKKDHNECVEAAYLRVINIVKKVLMKPGTIYFERDTRQDSESAMAMHSFMTPAFYWHLQCSFLYDYEIEFAFDDCPYEAEIRHQLKVYPLDRATRLFEPQPSFSSFFDTVLFTQDDAHVHIL